MNMEIKKDCQNSYNEFEKVTAELGRVIDEINDVEHSLILPEYLIMKKLDELRPKRESLEKKSEEKVNELLKCQCNKKESSCDYFGPDPPDLPFWFDDIKNKKASVEKAKEELEKAKRKKFLGRPELKKEELDFYEKCLKEDTEILKKGLQSWLDCECKSS